MTDQVVTLQTYHCLSAGSTTILPNGKVITFGGSIVKEDHGTKVGKGTYSTDRQEEIDWLDSLCKMQSPTVWKEVAEALDPNETPAAVQAGIVADTNKVVAEVKEQAATAATVSTKADQLAAKAAAVGGASN